MKSRRKRRMPIPQHEFGFTVEVFRLFSESGLDGERITRERDEAEAARQVSAAAQTKLFQSPPREASS